MCFSQSVHHIFFEKDELLNREKYMEQRLGANKKNIWTSDVDVGICMVATL